MLMQNEMDIRKLIIPLTGGLDSLTLSYALMYGFVNPLIYTNDRLYTHITFTVGASTRACAGVKDTEWFLNFIKSSRFRFLSKVLKTLYGTKDCQIEALVTVSYVDSKIDINYKANHQYFLLHWITDLPKILGTENTILLGLLNGELPYFNLEYAEDYLNSYLKLCGESGYPTGVFINSLKKSKVIDYSCKIDSPFSHYSKNDIYYLYKHIVPEDIELNVSVGPMQDNFKETRLKELKEFDYKNHEYTSIEEKYNRMWIGLFVNNYKERLPLMEDFHKAIDSGDYDVKKYLEETNYNCIPLTDILKDVLIKKYGIKKEV